MKLALIGTGKIIEDALFAMEPVKTIERTAVFARPHSRDKAEKLAKQYAIKEVYTDYEELLKKTEADTVYIGLINSAHYPYAKQALLAGKNVILEKPFTGFYEETKELAQIANEKKLFIFEAITVLHNEVFYEMKKNLNKLGNIRMALCNYSQYSSRYDAYLEGDITHSFDPAYYGGSLYDINVYNVHYCVGLFGEPKNATYYPNVGPNGIDTSGTLVMEYDGFSAVCTGSKDSDSPGYVSIQGNPFEESYEKIVEQGLFNREGGDNIMVKVPVIEAGLKAIRTLLDNGAPINATEVMSVRQTLDVCEVYTRAIRGLHAPPRCIFPISPASSMNISQRVPYGMASIFPRTTCGRRVLRWLKKSTRPFGKTRRPWALSAAAPVGCTTLPKWLAARRLLPSTGRVPRKN